MTLITKEMFDDPAFFAGLIALLWHFELPEKKE